MFWEVTGLIGEVGDREVERHVGSDLGASIREVTSALFEESEIS